MKMDFVLKAIWELLENLKFNIPLADNLDRSHKDARVVHRHYLISTKCRNHWEL